MLNYNQRWIIWLPSSPRKCPHKFYNFNPKEIENDAMKVQTANRESQVATSNWKTYLLPLGLVSVNYGLFGAVRALVQQIWIQGQRNLNLKQQVVANNSDILLLCIAGVCCLLVQILLRIGKPSVEPIWKLFSASLAALQGGILLYVSVTFLVQYPPSKFIYSQGGVIAAFSSGLSSSYGAVLIFLHAWMCSKSNESQSLTKSQRGFELSVLIFICYILAGGAIFMKLESWEYEKSIQFCMVTLLTIGYGNIVARTFWGRFAMILYTTFGLLVAGYYALSFEELILEKHYSVDTDKEELSPTDDVFDAISNFDESRAESRSSSLETNPSLFNLDDGFWNSLFAQRLLTTLKFAVWICLWWFGVSAVFASQEPNWTYLDSLYFSFVTMTGF